MECIHQNGKNCDFEKMHPGCLGKMANLFERNIGLSGNGLLTDKPHQDGSPLSMSRPAMPRMGPTCDPIDGKAIVPDIKSNFPNRKSNGTSMKMLIAQEMSKEVNSGHDPPNLVAKLMGLDSCPGREPNTVTQRIHSRGYLRNLPDSPVSHQEQQNVYVDPNECHNFYEVLQQAVKSPHKGVYEETLNDKRMALVRQKFIEAKHMSMDKKLRQSKQFQEALEVLSSNKDLFLECLQEPNSMFYQQSAPLPPEGKRITVLRPSIMPDGNSLTVAGDKDGKQIKRAVFLQVKEQLEGMHPGSPRHASLKYYENSTQPTHIVVLKPSPGKLFDLKAASPQAEACSEDFFEDVEVENPKSREDAIVTDHMCEKLARHCRDDTLNSSTFSNGYVGDRSSFIKSEIVCADDNLRDSAVMSSGSRHSWDYGNNRIGSPSSSTFSRPSSSPKSSVSREAKKRLSERWAMMVSKGSCQEPKHTRRSPITLGEMLALSESKKAASPSEACCSSQQLKSSNSLLVSEVRQDENVDSSPRTLLRSKSLPSSSTEFGTKLHIGISVSDKGKPEAAEEKKTSNKSSFKGKVSSLFFSRNRKPGKDLYIVSEAKNEGQLFPGKRCKDGTGYLSDEQSNMASPVLQEPFTKASSSSLISNHAMTSPEIGLPAAEPVVSENPGENQDELSPVSVLDLSFEGEEHSTKGVPQYPDPDQHGVRAMGSNLIDKSPLIGSVACTRSWDKSGVETASSLVSRENLPTQETYKEEKECFLFVKTLLSAAGLDGEVQSNSLLARWHSPESPLDPSLRDQPVYIKDMEALHEVKRRQNQLTQRLMFDCVHAALVEITEYGFNNSIREGRSLSLVDEVWAQTKGLFSGEVRCLLDDCGDNENCLVVESVVRNEVANKGWVDELRLEMDNLGKELEGELVEELVQEAVVELKGRS